MSNASALLRGLVDLRDKTIQKARIGFENRVRSALQGADDMQDEGLLLLNKWQNTFNNLEKAITKDLEDFSTTFPIVQEMSKLYGVGAITAAKVISLIDITKCPHISSLWKYSGYGQGDYWLEPVKTGGAFYTYEDRVSNIRRKVVAPKHGIQWKTLKKPVKDKVTGELITKEKIEVTPVPKPGWLLMTIRDVAVPGYCLSYNKRLKTNVWSLVDVLIKWSDEYRAEYHVCKEYYVTNRPKWPSGQQSAAARRKVMKLFLSHLWVVWRTLEKLPVTLPYAIEKLGHEHLKTPEQFGWYATEEMIDAKKAIKKVARAEKKALKELEA